MDDSFDQDGPERTSSGAGVKALRERLEQQNREVPSAWRLPALVAAPLAAAVRTCRPGAARARQGLRLTRRVAGAGRA
jgi:hypothetical protein